MEQADLIWHNGELVAWEDAKVHVLTHGLHYGTGVFEGIRAYETPHGHGDLPPPRPPRPAVQVGRALLHADPVHARGAARGHPRADRGQRAARVLHPPDRRSAATGRWACTRSTAPVEVSIAVWPWGAYLGEEGKRDGRPRQGLELAADPARRADPARQGLAASTSTASWPRSRPPRPATRRRSCSTPTGSCARARARTSTWSATATILTPPQTAGILDGISRKSVIQIAARPRLRGRRARPRAGRAVPRRRGVPVRHRGRARAGARDRRPRDRRRRAAGRSPREIQRVFDDALHGRDPRYPTGSTSCRCRPGGRPRSGPR